MPSLLLEINVRPMKSTCMMLSNNIVLPQKYTGCGLYRSWSLIWWSHIAPVVMKQCNRLAALRLNNTKSSFEIIALYRLWSFGGKMRQLFCRSLFHFQVVVQDQNSSSRWYLYGFHDLVQFQSPIGSSDIRDFLDCFWCGSLSGSFRIYSITCA